MAVSTARLLTFVCMALAVLLLVFNFTSYSSLMRSAGSSSFSGYRTSAEKRRAAQLHAARRAMRHTRSKAHDILNWEPYDAAEEEDDDADDDDDDDNAEHGSRLAIGASTFDPNEENAERNRRKQRRGQQQQGLEGEEETPHGGAGGGAAAATSSTPLPTAEVASVVGSAVSSTVSSVVTSAIGTANAAAAAVTHVADRLRSTAGNGACKPGKPDWPQRPLNFVAALEAPVWPVGCTSDPVVVAAGGDTLCVQLARAAVHREVVLTIVDDESPDADEQRRGLPAFLTGGGARGGRGGRVDVGGPCIVVGKERRVGWLRPPHHKRDLAARLAAAHCPQVRAARRRGARGVRGAVRGRRYPMGRPGE
jgi:hypothetical protein